MAAVFPFLIRPLARVRNVETAGVPFYRNRLWVWLSILVMFGVLGGLASFGEAIPAQAIAQVCELTWQLRGQAEGRQVEGAKAGVTVNQGLFGHGSSVICTA